MNNKPTEEEARKAIEAIETVENYQGGEYVDIGTYAAEHFEEIYKDMKPVLDNLRKHDTGEEEIKPIKI